MTADLRQRSVLVTGAASGIGRAIAERAVRAGADVLAVDVRKEPLAALVDRIGCEGHVMDVGDPSAWVALAGRARGWDHVFLNAGVMSAPSDAPLEASDFVALPLERYRRIVSVNVDGVAFGLRAVIPRMREVGGSIVATASIAGLIPYSLDPAYAMTKHAVIGLVRSLAPTLTRKDGGPPIRLCAICPGGVRTDLVPQALRAAPAMMEPSVLAEEAVDLCLHGRNGEVRAKVLVDAPAQVFEPPRIDLL